MLAKAHSRILQNCKAEEIECVLEKFVGGKQKIEDTDGNPKKWKDTQMEHEQSKATESAEQSSKRLLQKFLIAKLF